MATKSDVKPFRSTLVSIGLLAGGVFLWCAFWTFDAGDWPSPHQYPHPTPAANACGVVGACLAYGLHYWLGDGTYPVLLFATIATLFRMFHGSVSNRAERAFGLALLTICTSASAHLISDGTGSQLPVGHGGVLGHAMGELLRQSLDRLGTLIVLAASLVIGLTFATGGWVLRIPPQTNRIGYMVTMVLGAPLRVLRWSLAVAVGASSTPETLVARRLRPDSEGDFAQGELFEGEDEGVTAAADSGAAADGLVADEAPSRARGKRRAGKAAKPVVGPIVNFPVAEEFTSAEPYPRHIENWCLPSLDLLEEPTYGFDAEQEQAVRAQAKVLERTLEDFRVDARVVEIDTGPVITMFELRLGAGIKVSQIVSLSNDIARALKAHGIRVVAPISGKNTVGIEVPNIKKETVRLRDVIMATGKRAGEMSLPLFLGKDAGGAAMVSDLTLMPHLLIAGTTGSGKSVCLNSIILSILLTKRPDHVKLILIDPKMVELSQFKSVPHLMCPIVNDVVRAEKILEWAVTKMDERYALLAEARVKNVAGYNGLGDEELYRRLGADTEVEQARVSQHMPFIVIVIDELADLMMTAGREVEHHLSRLAQKSRAVGIHIIVATQRPEAKVVTGLIKSNMPSRICFRVASRVDSRIVLDRNGGEVLLGQGDMLFLPPGSHKLIRSQGTFLEDSEVHAVLDDLASRASPEFHPELLRIRNPETGDSGELRDPVFNQAVEIVLQSRRGSASLLQRRLTIGYSRASRLIEQMAEAGIVGDYKGSQAREVLVSLEQWEAILAQAAADAEAGYEADAEDDAYEIEDGDQSEADWDLDTDKVEGSDDSDTDSAAAAVVRVRR